MSATPEMGRSTQTSLAGVAWLQDDRLQRLMRAISGDDEETRIVGGAVRNELMGRPVADIDLATTARPEIVTDRARAHGMKVVPTGIAHGTVTIIVEGHPFEVTTLREDVETDGRRAKVTFGRDWSADAHRRDFTVNALYARADGTVIDLVDGLRDCNPPRIRFIGEPADRIREDYLRILRLFRFHATFCDRPVDEAGLAAAIALRDGLSTLSAERIGQEILKLIVADHAPDVVEIMQRSGILALALATEALDIDPFNRLHGALATLSRTAPLDCPADPAALLIVAMTTEGYEGSDYLARRLRLSNAIRNRMTSAWKWSDAVVPDLSERDARALLYRAGSASYRDALMLAAIRPASSVDTPRLRHLLSLPSRFEPPRFPISGRDLLARGMTDGPQIGRAIAMLQSNWIASDFSLTRDQMLAGLDQSEL